MRQRLLRRRIAFGFALLLVTCAGGAASSAAPRPASVILFWSDSPVPSIWSIRPDGSHRHRILRTRQNSKRPQLSPDRKWVVYDGTPPGERPLTDFDIEVVRLDGTGRRTLTTTEDWDLDAQWSPDGTRISFSRSPPGPEWRESSVWTMRPDGTDARALVRGSGARWSPDGRRLVFTAPTARSDGDLFVVNADGSSRRALLTTPRLEQPEAWSPDGRHILFSRFLGSSSSDLFVLDVETRRVRRLTRAPGGDFGASWSPDGSRIVFSSDRLGRTHLFLMRADGTRQHPLTNGSASDFEPSWR